VRGRLNEAAGDRAEAKTPRQLVAALGGSGNIAGELRISSAAVRQWAVRGYVPYTRLLELAPAMKRRGIRYAGPVTPGLAEAPR
jgi:hypothetical protein